MVGMSVLSGTGPLVAAAAANEHWLAGLSFASSEEISRKEAAVAWARQARGRHLRGLLSAHELNSNAAAGRIRARLLSAAKTGVAGPPEATIKGVSHNVKGEDDSQRWFTKKTMRWCYPTVSIG